jgi:RNA:NAD 2'-phosphotransferase (TPT1/KptA family)
MSVNEVRARKLLDLVLRHRPEIIGITLDAMKVVSSDLGL